MKRKITYLLKDFDEIIKTFLKSSKNVENQVDLLKQKQQIFEEIDKMLKKYDKIINSIREQEEENEI